MKLKNNVILISGKQGAGKSSVAKELVELLKVKSCKSLKFADPIYKMHNEIQAVADSYGLPTLGKDGELLQYLGTEWGRKRFGENVWVDVLKARVKDYHKHFPNDIIIIDDCRFPNEFDAFPNALKVRLECKESLRKRRCSFWRKNAKHASEIALDNYVKQNKFHRVYNSGVLSAHDIAADIIRLLS